LFVLGAPPAVTLVRTPGVAHLLDGAADPRALIGTQLREKN
jgi:hypothetical protein